jgi:hypothetical protein
MLYAFVVVDVNELNKKEEEELNDATMKIKIEKHWSIMHK